QTSRVPYRCESIHVTASVDFFSGRVVFGFHTDGRMVRKCHITKQLNPLPAVAGRSFLAPFIAGVSLLGHMNITLAAILSLISGLIGAAFGHVLSERK